MLKGSIVALVTPMHEDGSIDRQALAELIEWHIAAKTNGIVAAGTTGESATLDHQEHYELVSFIVQQVNGRVPVIAGTGTNSTRSTIALTEQAKRAGADACLIVTPYYNKPTQKGLYQHYKTVAENTDLPIILYNVPNRTACDILPETVMKLSGIRNIVAIKEATGKLERAQAIMENTAPDFIILSGDDPTALAMMEAGADGVISVTANVAPAKMQAMCDAALNQDLARARALNQELSLLHQRLFIESNPIPTKWALHKMGKIKAGIRLPLLPLDNQYHEAVKEAMQNAGVIENAVIFTV